MMKKLIFLFLPVWAQAQGNLFSGWDIPVISSQVSDVKYALLADGCHVLGFFEAKDSVTYLRVMKFSAEGTPLYDPGEAFFYTGTYEKASFIEFNLLPKGASVQFCFAYNPFGEPDRLLFESLVLSPEGKPENPDRKSIALTTEKVDFGYAVIRFDIWQRAYLLVSGVHKTENKTLNQLFRFTAAGLPDTSFHWDEKAFEKRKALISDLKPLTDGRIFACGVETPVGTVMDSAGSRAISIFAIAENGSLSPTLKEGSDTWHFASYSGPIEAGLHYNVLHTLPGNTMGYATVFDAYLALNQFDLSCNLTQGFASLFRDLYDVVPEDPFFITYNPKIFGNYDFFGPAYFWSDKDSLYVLLTTFNPQRDFDFQVASFSPEGEMIRASTFPGYPGIQALSGVFPLIDRKTLMAFQEPGKLHLQIFNY